jgi:hypothetical protein
MKKLDFELCSIKSMISNQINDLESYLSKKQKSLIENKEEEKKEEEDIEERSMPMGGSKWSKEETLHLLDQVST